MGTETFTKNGQKSRKVKKHRAIKQETLASPYAGADIGKVEPMDRRFSNNYSKNRPQITDQMEFDF